MDRTLMSRVVVMLLLISGIHRVAGKCIKTSSDAHTRNSVLEKFISVKQRIHIPSFCFSAQSCVSSYALGMESRAISDYQITASDYYRDGNTANAPQNARLNNEDIIGKTIIAEFRSMFRQFLFLKKAVNVLAKLFVANIRNLLRKRIHAVLISLSYILHYIRYSRSKI